MRAIFVDANDSLAAIMERLIRSGDPDVGIHRQPDITPGDLPAIVGDREIVIVDHTAIPTDIARQCKALKHIVFLGTGARSYMNPDELAEIGISVHLIKGYGDTAVAECAFALMWTAARGMAFMDREIRAGHWPRSDGIQLTGKTLGLVGFGGIGAEMARLGRGIGMKILAWNRTPKTSTGVEFAPLESVLERSDVVSVHMLLTDETRGFISGDKIARMKKGALLINTARGAIVDEAAMVEALKSGHLGGAGLDVFTVEPLPAGHVLTTLPNVVLSAHSAFRTPEASDNLIGASLDHCRRIAAAK